jgi:hypothetical protein
MILRRLCLGDVGFFDVILFMMPIPWLAIPDRQSLFILVQQILPYVDWGALHQNTCFSRNPHDFASKTAVAGICMSGAEFIGMVY